MTTYAELRNLQIWSSEVLGAFAVLWAVSYAVAKGLDWLADRDARRIAAQVDEQAERRRFQAVMAPRETSR